MIPVAALIGGITALGLPDVKQPSVTQIPAASFKQAIVTLPYRRRPTRIEAFSNFL